MRGLAWCSLVMLVGGCDSLMPEMPAPTYPELPAYRYGTVHWEGVQSDCVDGGWTSDETVSAIVEADRITLWFDTMPELSGTLATDGQAAVAGEMTFPGETGATVSCVVDGTAKLAADDVSGEMHERLSSSGDVNCDARGRYTVHFTR
ncbi:MAG: hypothetical protein U1F43_21035 [Myxococcota bacterium]